ncbi:MAG: hypothetical protein GTO55_07980 [Armatimonadetes bacterium]|nr:hypothetical protein [Armatimonadota bacterium]NIM24197.1 hypothetical protein [Armatimonadota bacterium]NIM68062.1 hypothetical protein [Armatimonadota bacterium]NIM76096.1 hypothetical protein [Armatimonadota bacterium]NIN05767.1 hypothetical protein [Armatimonadota bacterium]
MKFPYLRDPLFIGCLILYFVNRWLIKPLVAGGFFHDYLNDLICIPFWVPIMVFALRRLGLRSDDGPPRADEILIPLLMWSAIFELFLPRTRYFEGLAISDYVDVLWYAIGALVASVFWNIRYKRQNETPEQMVRAEPGRPAKHLTEHP